MDMLTLKHILDCDHLSYIEKLDDTQERGGVSNCEDG